MAKTTLTIDVNYNPEVTDPEGLASAMDRLLETALSTPGIMDEYGPPEFGEFSVAQAKPARAGRNEKKGFQTYRLRIDGPLLREQQKVLIGVITGQGHGQDTRQALDGILDLLTEVADQGHDRHGIDCLLCECEEPGSFYSGVPGILAHVENGKLTPGAKVERCDLCQRYPSDEAALGKLRELGYVQP